MNGDSIAVATELRDGLLQDLIALGLLVRIVERDLQSEAAPDTSLAALRTAEGTLSASVEELRSVIGRLSPTGRPRLCVDAFVPPAGGRGAPRCPSLRRA